jgi:hypothetical protein
MLLTDDTVLFNDGSNNHLRPKPDERLRVIADWYPNPYSGECERPWDVKWVANNSACSRK